MELSKPARNAFDRYLKTLRICLAGAPSLDREEIETEVRTHLERELETTKGPIGWVRMQVVLDRLGSPLQWVPEEQLSTLRRIWLHLQVGPESWRLAYLSLALLLASPIAAMQMGTLQAAAFLAAAFLCARAALVADVDDLPVAHARRFLALPALVPVYAAVTVTILFAGLWLQFELAEQVLRLQSIKPRFPEAIVSVADRILQIKARPHDLTLTSVALLKTGVWTLTPLGAWWALLGTLLRRSPRLVQTTFHPCSARIARTAGTTLLATGIVLAHAGLAISLLKHLHLREILAQLCV